MRPSQRVLASNFVWVGSRLAVLAAAHARPYPEAAGIAAAPKTSALCQKLSLGCACVLLGEPSSC